MFHIIISEIHITSQRECITMHMIQIFKIYRINTRDKTLFKSKINLLKKTVKGQQDIYTQENALDLFSI